MKSLKSIILSLCLLLIFVSGNSNAQSPDEIASDSYLLLSSTSDYCPAGQACGVKWRLSPHSTQLYAYTYANNQLHVIQEGTNTQHYDLSQFIVAPQYSDFVPYGDHQVILFDNISGELFIFDLNTQIGTKINTPYHFLPCSHDLPYHQDFTWVAQDSLLAMCARYSGENYSFILVNPNTAETQEIGLMTDNAILPEDRERLIGGFDQAVYMQDINSNIQRYDLQTNSWTQLPITGQTLRDAGLSTPAWLVSVDGYSNLYFLGYISPTLTPRYVKINQDGEVLWSISGEEINSFSHYFVQGTANGDLITIQGAATSNITLSGTTINIYPVSVAGPDQALTDTDASGSEPVTLDGSASTDPDGTIVSYSWAENDVEIATGVTPTVDLPVGEHTITLTITDNDDLTASDTVVITMQPPA